MEYDGSLIPKVNGSKQTGRTSTSFLPSRSRALAEVACAENASQSSDVMEKTKY